MDTPDRSTAAAFPRYLTGEVVADSVALQWPGLYARRWRLPRVVDRFLAPRPTSPATCAAWLNFRNGTWVGHGTLGGSAEATRSSRCSRTPCEVKFQSPPGQELDNLSIHIDVEPFLAALTLFNHDSGHSLR